MNINRRSFLLGTSALALSGCATGSAVSAADRRALRLKFGVLSDIHITDWNSTEVFRKALRHFRDAGADAVMIAGDMADHGILCQLENVARAWDEVFPGDRGLGGRHVEKLFIYGNHDLEGLAYRDDAMDKAFLVHGVSREEAKQSTLRTLGLAECWERCFRERYEPIYRKTVKGYTFVGAHWDTWTGVRGLEDWFAAHSAEIPTEQPFFFFQHSTPFGTVYGPDTWGDDEGQSVRALAAHPNAVAFSGHSHLPLTDDRCCWRGEFTSIGTSSLSYVCLPEGRQNCPDYRDRLDCRHGQLVSVFDDRLEIERRDFVNDENLGETVTVPLPTRVSSFTVRGSVKAELPAFPKGAKATLRRDGDTLLLTFPGAFANPTARPFDYKVRFEFNVADKDGKTEWKRFDRYFFQPSAAFSRARAAAEPIRFVLPAEDVPQGMVLARVSVVARNCYGVGGPAKLGASQQSA